MPTKTSNDLDSFFLKLKNFSSEIRLRIEAGETDTAKHLTNAMANDIEVELKDFANEYAAAVRAHNLKILDDLQKWAAISKTEFREDQKILLRIHETIKKMEAEAGHVFGYKGEPSKPSAYRLAILAASIAGVIGIVSILAKLPTIIPKRNGLQATYYASTDLSQPYKTRIENRLEFNWGNGSPFRDWAYDGFSVGLAGFIKIPRKGNYEFKTESDDGVRFYIGRNALIDDWNWHSLSENNAEVILEEGYYPIRLEFFDLRGFAFLRLRWKPAYEPAFVEIPEAILVPDLKYLAKDAVLFDGIEPDKLVRTVKKSQEDYLPKEETEPTKKKK